MAHKFRTAAEILSENPWMQRLSVEEQKQHIVASWVGDLLKDGVPPEEIAEILIPDEGETLDEQAQAELLRHQAG